MTGRQAVGMYMLIGMALLLLRVLPRRSLYSRLLLTRWDVHRKERFGQPGRRDFLRYALYSLVGGIGLAAATFFGVSAAMEHARPFSRLETWLSGGLFGGMIISGMCVVGSLVLIVRAIAWKPLPPLAFRLYRGKEPVGETQLEREALSEGIVSGALRPFPAFANLAPAVKALSTAIASSPDVTTTKRLIDEFSRGNTMEVVDGSGAAVDANSVIVVDLEDLKLGQGLWAEVNLRDVNTWQTPPESAGAQEGSRGRRGSGLAKILSRLVEILVGVVGVTMAGVTIWMTVWFLKNRGEVSTPLVILLAIAYILVLLAIALAVYSTRLIIPRLRLKGGRIIGRKGLLVAALIYSFLIVSTIVNGDGWYRQSAILLVLVVLYGMASRWARGSHR